MHIQLTDILSCPRCGPAYGLILRADRMEARRVSAGALGCPNCRTQYPIQDGVVWLVSDDRRVARAPSSNAVPNPEDVLRIAAMLGVTQGPAVLVLVGPAASAAALLAELIPGVEVIAATPVDEPLADTAAERVNRLVFTGALPFVNDRLAGVLLSGQTADRLLEDAGRTLRVGARLVLDPAPPNFESRVAAAALKLLLCERAVVVATRL